MCFVFETLASAQFSMCSEHWRKQLQKLKRYRTLNFQCKMCRLISMGCIENGALASVSVSGAARAKVSNTLEIRPWQLFRPLEWLTLKIHDSLGYRFMIVAFSFFFLPFMVLHKAFHFSTGYSLPLLGIALPAATSGNQSYLWDCT